MSTQIQSLEEIAQSIRELALFAEAHRDVPDVAQIADGFAFVLRDILDELTVDGATLTGEMP